MQRSDELLRTAAQRAVLLSRAVADRIRHRLLPFPRHHAAELKHELEKMVAKAWIAGYREAVADLSEHATGHDD